MIVSEDLLMAMAKSRCESGEQWQISAVVQENLSIDDEGYTVVKRQVVGHKLYDGYGELIAASRRT